jgi:hypothetical protein
VVEPITQARLDASTWEVDIDGRRFPAVASLQPLSDPRSARVRM